MGWARALAGCGGGGSRPEPGPGPAHVRYILYIIIYWIGRPAGRQPPKQPWCCQPPAENPGRNTGDLQRQLSNPMCCRDDFKTPFGSTRKSRI